MAQTKIKKTAKQLGWFIALWLAGVATVTTVGYGIRWMIL